MILFTLAVWLQDHLSWTYSGWFGIALLALAAGFAVLGFRFRRPPLPPLQAPPPPPPFWVWPTGPLPAVKP